MLITVLSVMNGFDYEIRNRIFSMAEHVKVSTADGTLADWSFAAKKASSLKQVVAVAPFVTGQGMVSNAGMVSGVLISGVLPSMEKEVSEMGRVMVWGSIDALKAGEFRIIVGQELASRLGVGIGDKMVLITPQSTATPVGVLPRFKRFTVVGIFHVGEGFGYYDTGVVFMHLDDAQKLLQLGSEVSGLRLKVKNLYDAPLVSEQLSQILTPEYVVSDWTQEYGAYFKAIRMEKTTMFVLLLFIVAVAAFNLVSGLVMTVTDKRSDIAILRTLGASPRNIMSIFIVQGSIIGFAGTVLGVVGGILLALNAPSLVTVLEHCTHTKFISAAIYFINYLPSKLIWTDVLKVSIATFIMSLLVTIYPAWRAAQTQPAEALRYE